MNQESIQAFVKTLDIPEDAKDRLLELTPSTYVGLAPELAAEV